jgi:hypothetical protein
MAPAFEATRLLDAPILVSNMDERMGANLNGPSLVRVPEWVPNRLGDYYLYFAHHNGTYIRLAYADHLEGPWRIHSPGTLQHEQSFFPAEIGPPDPERTRSDRLRAGAVISTPHIASPDVHVDEAERRFRMYYHGIIEDRTQVSRVATSNDGIHFEAHEPILGRSYWRVFEHRGWHYALAMPGIFYRSRDPLGPFEQGPTLFASNMRHSAVLLDGDTLSVFYTNVGETPPERILATSIDLAGDWSSWETSAVAVVLEPERDYEGADLPLEPSIRGEISVRARQLRDPAVFRDVDGRLYLLYAVAGESGIGLAELHESRGAER